MKTETKTKDEIVQLNIDLRESEKTRIKVAAMLERVPMKEFVLQAVAEKISAQFKAKGVKLPFEYPPQCFVNANELFA